MNPVWPQRSYAAIIFDCDGTLVDSMPLHFIAWEATMRRYGIHFTEERFYSLAGVPTERIIRMLASEQRIEIDAPMVAIEKEQAFLDRIELLQAIPPVINVARHFRGKVPLAVASGGYRHIIELQLKQVGCQDWFQTMVTAEDTTRHKPEPDVFLEAAARMSVPANQCLVYEDSDLGIAAAQAAQMDWIDVRILGRV